MKKIQYNYSPTGSGDIEIKQSTIHGLGVFAKRNLPKNVFGLCVRWGLSALKLNSSTNFNLITND